MQSALIELLPYLSEREKSELDRLLTLPSRRAWREVARPDQRPPEGEWRVWLIMAGRGWGKTRSGAEQTREWIEQGERYVNLLAATFADGRDVMVEGESGLLAVAGDLIKNWNRSMGEIRWKSGARSKIFSSDAPERLRGPQASKIWGDEPGAWENAQAFWDMAAFGLRLGTNPQAVLTTTPKPTPFLRYVKGLPGTVITRGVTRDNAANLAPGIVDELERRYGGTRLGRQELEGELLEDNPHALWKREDIDVTRVAKAPTLVRTVVAVDPATTSRETSDETGIVVAGRGDDGRGYVLNDLSGRYTPAEMGRVAHKAYQHYRANAFVYESNQGGDFVLHTLQMAGQGAAYKGVHVSQGKSLRADPISALYEQHRVSHVGRWNALEDQMCDWVPGEDSPDRMDALVLALSVLFERGGNDDRPRTTDNLKVNRR